MKKEKCRLLSLDIWDTVLRRRCRPDEIKVITAEKFLHCYGNRLKGKLSAKNAAGIRIACERELGALSVQKGYDDEYEIHDVLRLWCKRMLDVSDSELEQMVEELCRFELETELKHVYLDSGILQLIDRIEYDRLVLISDFYAGKDFMECILRKAGFDRNVDEVYLSCECRRNKRSGGLFDFVWERERIPYEQWIHIGDNLYSDVEVPEKKGITAVSYIPQTETSLRTKRERSSAWEETKYFLQRIRRGHRMKAGDLSVFFGGFVTWLANEAVKKGIRSLYFFTREGEFYKELYDEIKKVSLSERKMPEAEVIEVSRLSTFMPSLREITLSEFMRIWNQYSVQSMKALFKSLHMDIGKVEKYLHLYAIPEEEMIQYPWKDERVQKLFSDKEFIKEVEAERDQKRKLIYDYLEQRGWRQDHNDTVGIVDIGWRGTIQDNLCYLYPKYSIHGFYIGLIPFLSIQPPNSEKYGFINGHKLEQIILTTVTPLEMLCNSPNGSAVGYQNTAAGVQAVRQKDIFEDDVFFSVIQYEQEKIKKKILRCCKEMKEQNHMPEYSRSEAVRALYLFIAYPRRKFVKAYFHLRHNEEFGVGEYVDKTVRLQIGLFVKAVFFSKYKKELALFLRDTTWAQGYFVKYWLYPAVWAYNWLLAGYLNAREKERKL